MIRALLGIVAWLLVVVGGGSLLARHDTSVSWIRELRFAGVDLIYALRRVAAEADRILLLDEMRPGMYTTDLFLVRVDVDLPAAPVEQTLEHLKSVTGRFDFRVEPDLIYVRSDSTLDRATEIDARVLRGGRFKGDLKELIGWLLNQLPGAFLNGEWRVGLPVFAVVELDIPPRSSVLDVLRIYARTLNFGWRMQRAGYEVDLPDEQLPPSMGRERQIYISSNVGLWPPLTRPVRVYPGRSEETALRAIASVSKRTGIPVSVVDRSLLGRNRGNLDMWPGVDGGLDLETALKQLRGRPDQHRFRWEWRDGVAYLVTDLFDFADTGKGILRDRVRGGHFEGGLPQLTRWVNENLKPGSSGQVLMGGEITGKEPTAPLDVPENATVEEVLLAFSRRSGQGFVFVAQEASALGGKADLLPADWTGGFLTQLSDWLEPSDYAIAH